MALEFLEKNWPIVDMHGHASYNNPESADVMARAAAEFGIQRIALLGDVIALGYHPTEDQVRIINDGNAAAVERVPGFFTGLCFLNPENSADFLREEIERCVKDFGFRGIKLEASINARSSRLDPIMEEAEKHGIFLLHHAWYNTLGETPDESNASDIADLASRFHNVPILMAHLGGARVRGIHDIRPFPNLHVDTSGSQPIGELVEYAVEVLGADRVVYGSDVPGRDFSAQLGRIFGARLGDEDLHKILHLNAERLLRLGKN